MAIEDDVLKDHLVFGDQKKFGRLPSIDFRDKQFMLSPPARIAKEGIKYYFTKPALNQGFTSQCVAYSGQQLLMSGSVINKPYKTPLELYKECQSLDEWEGDLYEGTSVRALFKVLRAAGYISEYNWAFDLATVVDHVLKIGPVILGTNWYESMFEASKGGFIRIKSNSVIVGGHAYMIKGVNVTKKCPDKSLGALRLINSWGLEWGQRGMAWLSFVDAERLINEAGEAATAKEIVFKIEQETV